MALIYDKGNSYCQICHFCVVGYLRKTIVSSMPKIMNTGRIHDFSGGRRNLFMKKIRSVVTSQTPVKYGKNIKE